MKRLTSFLALFASAGTLLCCALPALLVMLGAGAALAGLIAEFPQLIWLTENKLWIFGSGGVLILMALFARNAARSKTCPPDQKAACEVARDTTDWILWVSIVFYMIGSLISFIIPRFL